MKTIKNQFKTFKNNKNKKKYTSKKVYKNSKTNSITRKKGITYKTIKLTKLNGGSKEDAERTQNAEYEAQKQIQSLNPEALSVFEYLKIIIFQLLSESERSHNKSSINILHLL